MRRRSSETPLRVTVVGEGSSDRALVPIIEWVISENHPNLPFLVLPAEGLPGSRGGLRGRVIAALHRYPCEVLVVHRDSDGTPPQIRREEIDQATKAIATLIAPLVPVRQTEAWLLSDEWAIRSAAGNPNGKPALELGQTGRWDQESDAKQVLFAALRTAADLGTERMRRFDVYKAKALVASRTRSFAPLRDLNAFVEFESSIGSSIQRAMNNDA